MELDEPLDVIRRYVYQEWSIDCCDIDWDDEDLEVIKTLPDYEQACKDAWEELYDQGKVGTFLAVPVRYDDYGSSGSRFYVCDLNSANAVWVPGKNEIANMTFLPKGIKIEYAGSPEFPNEAVVTFNGEVVNHFTDYWVALKYVRENYPLDDSYENKMRTARKYAEGVLKTYEAWANGDVYGCVVQTYHLEDDRWVEEGDWDSCWGFIGADYAEETLKGEYFEPAVKAAEEKNAAEAAQPELEI